MPSPLQEGKSGPLRDGSLCTLVTAEAATSSLPSWQDKVINVESLSQVIQMDQSNYYFFII